MGKCFKYCLGGKSFLFEFGCNEINVVSPGLSIVMPRYTFTFSMLSHWLIEEDCEKSYSYRIKVGGGCLLVLYFLN